MAVTAMILAAGFGERLRPLTESLPKALVPVAGKPMITQAIEAVQRAGCTRIVVNAHHFAPLMREHFDTHEYDSEIILVEEATILGTGGGILNARPYLEDAEQFLLHNVDIASDFDFGAMLKAQSQSGALATLAVNRRNTARAVVFDAGMRFLGKEAWQDEGLRLPAKAHRFGFCGLHVLSSRLFDYDFPAGFADVFDLYRMAMNQGAAISGWLFDGYWTDLGTADRIRAHEQALHPTE